MRILHTSDWHFGKTLENISRLEEQKEFADRLCAIVKDQDIDLVLIAGDVFDTFNPSSAAEELFYSTVDRLVEGGKRAVIAIAGNHDSPERLCAAHSIATRHGIFLLGYPKSKVEVECGKFNNNDISQQKSEAVGITNELSKSQVIVVNSDSGFFELSLPGCKESAVIITLPFPSETRLDEVLDLQSDESILQKAYSDRVSQILGKLSENFREDTVNLIISHLFVMGGKESESERTIQVGGAMTVNTSVFPDKTHYVALGHLHRPQHLTGAQCPVYYSGSPLAYSFSEADYAKVVYIVDANPKRDAVIQEIYLNCGKPLKRWVAEKGIGQALQWCEEQKDQGAWIDLEVHTDRILGMDEQKRLRELNPGIINIRPVIKTSDSIALTYENRETKKIDMLFGDFVLHKTGTQVTEELLSTFLEMLNKDDSNNNQNIDNLLGGEVNETEVS